jgi:GR25 family glycosyltransferase involved in LPS biosynthesis
VINLDRSTDRLAEFVGHNAHMQASRFSAIDGAAVSRRDLIERGILATDLDYSHGALGNALSHRALWELSIEKNAALTICEDDAIFNRQFTRDAELIVNSLPKDWHLVVWGWNFDSYLCFDMIPGVSQIVAKFDQDRMRMGAAEFQSAHLMPRAFRLFRAFGLCCYSISPGGARTLKDFCLPFRKISVFFPGLNRSLDNISLDVMTNALYPRINAFVSFPPLVITKKDHAISTVQREQPPTNLTHREAGVMIPSPVVVARTAI